jgi:hypothetical protein
MSQIELLRRSTLFTGIPDQALTMLARAMIMRTFAANVILFHKDSPG